MFLKVSLVLLTFLGLLNTGYLTYEKLAAPAGGIACGVNGGCNTVLGSPYAQLGNFPLTMLGFGLYALLLIGVLWPFAKEQTRWWYLWCLASAGVAFSGYLMALLIWEIKAFCPYCLGSACTLATFWLTLLVTQKQLRSGQGLAIGLLCITLTALSSVGLYQIQKTTPPPLPPNFGILN